MQRVEIGTFRYEGQDYKVVYYSRGGSKSPKSVYLEGPKRITPKQIKMLGLHVFTINNLFKMQYKRSVKEAYNAENPFLRSIKRGLI